HGQPNDAKAVIVGRASAYLKRLASTPVKTVEVANFNQFLNDFRGEWPSSGDLATDLARIESLPTRGIVQYHSQSPRIQNKIDRYLEAHQQFLVANYSALSGALPKDIDLQKALEIKDNLVQESLNSFAEVGQKLATTLSGITDPATRVVLQIFFKEYYSRLSLDAKKQILMSILNTDVKLNDQEKLFVMIQNSGPQFQKLLQVIARQPGLPAELKVAFKRLESGVKPVPWWMVEQILKAEGSNYEFTYFERKPLGVGTMAQVHRSKIKWHGKIKDTASRFIKPFIDRSAKEDERVLAEVAKVIDSSPAYLATKGPLWSPVVSEISKTLQAEFDQEATKSRQISGKAYETEVPLKTPEYKGTIRIHVPDVYVPEAPTKLMVQELVIGKSLDKEASTYAETIPGLKRALVEAMAKVWANELMFGNGFYHADLHQGNFLVRVTEEAIIVNILDYGMGGVITPVMQRQVMVLGTAVALSESGALAKAIYDVSERADNKISEESFNARVQQKLAKEKSGGKPATVNEWLGWASDVGLKIPYDFINLSRGMIIMDNALMEEGSSMLISDIQKKLVLSHPKKAYGAITGTGVYTGKSLVKSGLDYAMGKSHNETAPTGPRKCEAVF
ncbi:MAG: AarF/ABC1/UbiB kinase family protein, partial [Proteobacteria bacterium]